MCFVKYRYICTHFSEFNYIQLVFEYETFADPKENVDRVAVALCAAAADGYIVRQFDRRSRPQTR